MLRRITISFLATLVLVGAPSYGWSDEVRTELSRLAIKLLANAAPGDCLAKNEAAINALVGSGQAQIVAPNRNLSQADGLENESHYFYLDFLLGEVTQENIRRLPSDFNYSDAYPVYRNLVREQKGFINRQVHNEKLRIKSNTIALNEVSARGLLVPRTLSLYQKALANFREGHFKVAFFYFSLIGHYVSELSSPFNVTGARGWPLELEPAMEKMVLSNVHSSEVEFEKSILKLAKKNGGWDLDLPKSTLVPSELFELGLASFLLLKPLTDRLKGTLWDIAPKGETSAKDLVLLQLAKNTVSLARVWNRIYLDSVEESPMAKRDWKRCEPLNFSASFVSEYYPDSSYVDEVQKMLGYSVAKETRSISSQRRKKQK